MESSNGVAAKRQKYEEEDLSVGNAAAAVHGKAIDERSRMCPYLDTINRAVLDFDFEKLCSISLSHLNVYACLVCGRYFQGRGTRSHAYTHSVQSDHHVFLNLETHKFYCLPDNYEVIDSSLSDIIYLLNPTYSNDAIAQLDGTIKMCRALDGNTYYQGFVGLNNIKANDYCNVILQILAHIRPIRDYFLDERNYGSIVRPPGDQQFRLAQRFGELMRKLWNPRHFRTHVSPHEMLQAVVLCSRKRFQFTSQSDGVDFLTWFLNALDASLRDHSDAKSKVKDGRHKSIVPATFRGRMRVYERVVQPVDVTESEKREEVDGSEKMTETKFYLLNCELPDAPLFPDEKRENIIPQVPLATVLSKFDGRTEKEYKTYKDLLVKRYELTKLPPYIILVYKRFVKNQFTLEKNPTIVNFPVRDVDFGELLSEEVRARHSHTVYDLVGNVVHQGSPDKGTYKCHVLHKGTGKWYELQDLIVTEILPQIIQLSESYIQIYELNRDIPNPFYRAAQTQPRTTDPAEQAAH